MKINLFGKFTAFGSARTVYFYRRFHGFTGGHLKVWDYYCHTKNSTDLKPLIYFDGLKQFGGNFPWQSERVNFLKVWNPYQADILFLAGMDWLSLPEKDRSNWPKPVINLIQGFDHTIPGNQLFGFLSNYAIRICVSREVAKAIADTGRVNGPIFTIENGIDLPLTMKIKKNVTHKNTDLLIAGIKHPEMAALLDKECGQLFGIRTKCLIAEISRSDFLQQMAESRITVFLPKKTEGFYLPSLEGMAMGTFIICPDCGGNRSHCISNFNCLMPDYAEKEIITSVKAALQMDKTSFDKILENATHTAQKHSLENERGQFYEILNKILSIGKNAKNWKLHFEKDDPKWQDLIS